MSINRQIITNAHIEKVFHDSNVMRMCEIKCSRSVYLKHLGQYLYNSRPFMCDTGLQAKKVKSDLDHQMIPMLFESHILKRDYRIYSESVLQLFQDLKGLSGINRVLVSVRNFFAPGDLVWHVDRSTKRRAIRVIWPLARDHGTLYTPTENIDLDMHTAYMNREHPLLSLLDRQVFDKNISYRENWHHRPYQVNAMLHCDFPFIKDATKIKEADPDSIAIHRFDTGKSDGTYHCSSSRNEVTPGLQTIFTATE